MQTIKKKGYPAAGSYITVFGSETIIRDGYFLAAVLRKLKGNITVPVLHCRFKEGYSAYRMGTSASLIERARWYIYQQNKRFKQFVKNKNGKKQSNA